MRNKNGWIRLLLAFFALVFLVLFNENWSQFYLHWNTSILKYSIPSVPSEFNGSIAYSYTHKNFDSVHGEVITENIDEDGREVYLQNHLKGWQICLERFNIEDDWWDRLGDPQHVLSDLYEEPEMHVIALNDGYRSCMNELKVLSAEFGESKLRKSLKINFRTRSIAMDLGIACCVVYVMYCVCILIRTQKRINADGSRRCAKQG